MIWFNYLPIFFFPTYLAYTEEKAKSQIQFLEQWKTSIFIGQESVTFLQTSDYWIPSSSNHLYKEAILIQSGETILGSRFFAENPSLPYTQLQDTAFNSKN